MSSGDETPVVAILAMPRLYPLDVTIPAHVFGRSPGYRVVVCDEETGAGGSGPPATDGVTTEIRATHTLEDAALADIVVVPGYEEPHLPVPEPYLRALRVAHERGARVVGLCTGVFALAAGGLLDGRTATIHWRYAEELRSAFPGVGVVENRLLVEDGRILTSAGASAGIDACLHLIETDFGTVAADSTAREVVSAPARPAAEPQYRDHGTARPGARDDVRATVEWVTGNLAAPITVQRMAERSRMSRRTFVRHFQREKGMPPMRWVLLQRVIRARLLLETGDWTVERVAAETGFGTSANFRVLFRRETGVSPAAYRRLRGADGDDVASGLTARRQPPR